MSHTEHKIINYSFMYNKSAVVSSTNTSDLMVKGDKYIWVEDGNNISEKITNLLGTVDGLVTEINSIQD